MSGLVETLRQLVALDTTSAKSNLPIIDNLEERLTSRGFTCQRHPYMDEAGVPKENLVALAGQGRPELALVGHTDCVPFDANWADALRLTARDGKLFGRGACDTKGFIACALEAADATRGKLKAPLALIFTADEEVGCLGAKKLVEAKAAQPKRAIVGEPTSLTPVRAHKGYCFAEVEIFGKEGHSAYPASGANAIFRAARFIQLLEARALGPLRVQVDPAFEPPYTTVNVGLISGGKAKNVLAGSCRFTVEWRPIPAQSTGHVLELLETLRAELTAQDEGFRMEVRVRRQDRGADTHADAEVVRYLCELTGKTVSTVAFGTEAPQLMELGAEAVVFGPGDIQVAHQTGEFVPEAELTACAAMLERAVLHYCA